MALTDAQKNEFNDELDKAFIAILANTWSVAELHFDKAYQLLLAHANEIPFEPNSVKHLLFLFKCICQFQADVLAGKTSSTTDDYLKKVGVSFYSQSYQLPPPLYQAQLLQLIAKYPWIKIKLTSKQSNQLFLKDLNYVAIDFLKSLNTQATALNNTNKSYYLPHLTHGALRIPTYLDYVLAANDAYERSTTSANPLTPNCTFVDKDPAVPTLKSLGWELVETAHTIPSYKPDEYFGKVYIDNKRKMVLIAHKGTTFKCTNDLVQDHEIFKRRIPEKYLKQANELLDNAQKYLAANALDDYKIFMTGHSLGGALAELLACQHLIPATTLDSAGVQQIIENNPSDFKVSVPEQAPVIGIMSLDNIINTCNGHVGRTLQIGRCRELSYVLPIPNITVISLLKSLIKWSITPGIGIKTMMQLFINESDINNISTAVRDSIDSFYDTLRTHSLNLFIRYFIHDYPYFQPDGLYTITRWPNGIQDGTTVPEVIKFQQRIMPLSYFSHAIQIVLNHANEITTDPNFPINYDALKDMLNAITITDKYGGECGVKDHVLIKGALTIDEFRLFLWGFRGPQHQNLQAFLKTYIDKYSPKESAVSVRGLLKWMSDNPIPALAIGTITGGLAYNFTHK